MGQFEGWELGNVLLIPFVVYAVQVAKRFSAWMREGERAFGLCLILATALGVLYQWLVNTPTTWQGWILAMIGSLAFGFAAGKAYDQAKEQDTLQRWLERAEGNPKD